jgi:hypothetical protein
MAQNLSEALHERLDAMGAPRADGSPAPQVAPGGGPETDYAEPEGGTLPETEDDESEYEVLAEGPDDTDETDDDDEGDDAEQADGQQAEGQKFKVSELAEAIGWEASDLYNDLIVPLGNGETVTLGQLKDERETIVGQQAEVEKARAEIQQQAQALQQAQQQMLMGQQAVSEEIDNARGELKGIEAQYANVDWDKLEEQNPGQAANLRQKFATAYAQAQQKLEQAQTQHQQQFQQTMQQMMVAHDQKLLEVLPQWRDRATFEAEMPEIRSYLNKVGFTDQELGNIFDWRARYLARQAWLWEKHQGQVEQAKSKVRKAPKKLLRSGKPVPRREATERKVSYLEQQARNSGRRDDRLAAARAIVQSSIKR